MKKKFGWTIITTEGTGKMLQQRCIKAGYKTFLPQERSFVFRRGQKEERLTPLFPGYLFVDVRGNWRKLLQVQGVDGFLMSYAKHAEDNRPIVVPQSTIDKLRLDLKLDADDVVIPLSAERFKKGQRVEATAGAFEGMPGTYVMLLNHHDIVDFGGSLGHVCCSHAVNLIAVEAWI